MTSGARPLLVTGLPRSGTSWVGKMLEASGAVVYINEPLNVRHPPGRSPGVLDAHVNNRFPYICADNEVDWLPAFTDMVQLRYRLEIGCRNRDAVSGIRGRGAANAARVPASSCVNMRNQPRIPSAAFGSSTMRSACRGPRSSSTE